MHQGVAEYPEKFQSTPPHGRRLKPALKASRFMVSIHASAWEATYFSFDTMDE